MFANFFASFCLLPIIVATPLSAGIDTRASSLCGKWDSVKAGPYSLLLDLWGSSHARSGYGCATLKHLSGTTIAWENSWNWEGGSDGVKSYTNVQLDSGLNKQLSAISSIPATWKWSQTTLGTVVANVAYDLFTSYTPGGKNVHEVMVWLANYNAGPISAAYNSNGVAKPIVYDISLAGKTWDLYLGSNGANDVFSFLPSNGASIRGFSGDLNVFIKYLTETHRISSAEFLTTAQGGTEATSGSATFTASAYSLVIN